MPDRGQILQELARRGALPEQHRAEYERLRTAGNIAPPGGFKPMPDAAATKLEEQVNAFAGFDRAVSAFKDDYSGPGSGIENTAQGVFGTGTPGQRDWWSDFRSSDNVARNALFGASLTPSEQASYAATSITPNMTPSEIRKNLSRRRELAQQMLDRRAAFARSNGYMPEAVAAILGDYDPAKRKGEVVPLNIDSATDFALGLRERGKPEQRADGSIAVRMPDGGRADVSAHHGAGWRARRPGTTGGRDAWAEPRRTRRRRHDDRVEPWPSHARGRLLGRSLCHAGTEDAGGGARNCLRAGRGRGT